MLNLQYRTQIYKLLIPKETIDKIFDASRIEEVVGDFLPLKKRGVNLLGITGLKICLIYLKPLLLEFRGII
jgi:hypothetical protein